MTADALKTLEEQIDRRERRSFRVAVLWGFAIFVLVLGVGYSLYKNEQQDDQIQTFSACAERPNSDECIKGHANSVARTTHAEACYILAKGGIRCKDKPLPESSSIRRTLLIQNGEMPDEVPYRDSSSETPTSVSSNSGDAGNPAVPSAPRTLAPSKPSQPSPQPSPEPAPPAEPAQPALTRPLIDVHPSFSPLSAAAREARSLARAEALTGQ